MTDLKRCPFCGGEAETKKSHVIAEHQYWIAYCYSCDARSVPHSSQEGAIEAWNTRPNPWHTGTPTEEGVYLCASENEFRKYGIAYWDGEGFHSEQVGRIVKWQKIEENEDGRTD